MKSHLVSSTGSNDSKYELRLDAGESQDGKKRVYLRVNSQAKNDALRKFRGKHGSHANLAVGSIDESRQQQIKRKQQQVYGSK